MFAQIFFILFLIIAIKSSGGAGMISYCFEIAYLSLISLNLFVYVVFQTFAQFSFISGGVGRIRSYFEIAFFAVSFSTMPNWNGINLNVIF